KNWQITPKLQHIKIRKGTQEIQFANIMADVSIIPIDFAVFIPTQNGIQLVVDISYRTPGPIVIIHPHAPLTRRKLGVCTHICLIIGIYIYTEKPIATSMGGQ